MKYFFHVHAQTQRMSKKMDKMMEEVAKMHERILSLAHAHSLSHAQAIERIDQLAVQECKDPNSTAYRAYRAYRAYIPARCPGMQRP